MYIQGITLFFLIWDRIIITESPSKDQNIHVWNSFSLNISML